MIRQIDLRNKRVMIGLIGILIVVLCIIMIFTFGKGRIKEEKDVNYLHELTMKCIQVEEIEKIMNTGSEGEIKLWVEMPDFVELFQGAKGKIDGEESLEKYIENALISENYSTVQREVIARVRVEDGETMVYSDDAIKELLEQELTNAINTVMGGE